MENIEDLKFFTAAELLELLRRLNSTPDKPCTDYRLAQILGVTQAAVAKVIKHGGSLSEDTAVILSEKLSLPLGYVLICINIDRAKNEKARDAWHDAGYKLLRASCFVLAGYLLNFLPSLPFMS